MLISAGDITTGNKNGIVIELNDGSLVVGTANPFHVYKSTDSGATWCSAKYTDTHPNKAARSHYWANNG